MNRPAFMREMRSLKTALVYQSDFQLLSVAASVSHVLHGTVPSGSEEETQHKETETILGLLKLSHARQRFAPDTGLLPSKVTSSHSSGNSSSL
jgi:hypothetical protein